MLAESSWLPEWEHRKFLADALHLLAVPVLSAGYVAGIVVAFEGGRGRRLLTPFASVGRMALTNYLTQSLVFGFVLFGIGPGLALAGKIGTMAIVGIVIGFFASAGRREPLVVRAIRLWPCGMGVARADLRRTAPYENGVRHRFLENGA